MKIRCQIYILMEKVIVLRKIRATMRTILQPFQFEREQKKRVIMRAMTKKLQKQSFADILQNRSFEKFRKFRIKTPVLESLFKAWRPATLRRKDSNTGVFLWNLRNFENIFFIEHLQSLLLKLNILMLQLPIFYIVEFEVSESYEKETKHIYTSAAYLLHIRIGIRNWCKCRHCKSEAREIDCHCSREVDAILIASAKILESERSISPCSFYG